MTKKILILMLACASASMLAMEPTNDVNYDDWIKANENKDDLGEHLTYAIHAGKMDTARKLIQRGANMNYIDLHCGYHGTTTSHESALMQATHSMHIADNERLSIVQELIDNGADVNLINLSKENALMLSGCEEVDKLLIQAGANIYQHSRAECTALLKCANRSYRKSATNILAVATRLTPAELNSVKNWLLVDQRLRQGLYNEGNLIEKPRADALPKDLKKPIARHIYISLANDLREQVIKAGALSARKRAIASIGQINGPAIVHLLNQHLDLHFLEGLVRAQLAELLRMIPEQLN